MRRSGVVEQLTVVIVLLGVARPANAQPSADPRQQARLLWAIGNQMGGVHHATAYDDRTNTLRGLRNVIDLLRSSPCMDAEPWIRLLNRLEAGASPRSLFQDVMALEDVPAGGANLALFTCQCTPAAPPSAPLSAAGCRWVDGMDAAAPADDPGRGTTAAEPHYRHALGPGRAQVHALVGRRLVVLQQCLPRDAHARAYADVSVRVAQAGRDGAGWSDGLDPNGPGDDRGRGVASWQAHHDHVASGRDGGNTPALVERRFAVLRDRLGVEAYARLYADVSVRLALYGTRGGAPR